MYTLTLHKNSHIICQSLVFVHETHIQAQFLDLTIDAIQKWPQKIISRLVFWGEIDLFSKIYATMGYIYDMIVPFHHSRI